MGRIYLGNAFSLGMLPPNFSGVVHVRRNVPVEDARAMLNAVPKDNVISVVGHSGTAQVMSELLGYPVNTNRVAITLQPGDTLIVFQLNVRLQEGQLLSSEEVKKLYSEGKANFDIVWL